MVVQGIFLPIVGVLLFELLLEEGFVTRLLMRLTVLISLLVDVANEVTEVVHAVQSLV